MTRAAPDSSLRSLRVTAAIDGPEVVRRVRTRIEFGRRMAEMQDALVSKAEALRQALDQVKTLSSVVVHPGSSLVPAVTY
jgi:hypothetical protein